MFPRKLSIFICVFIAILASATVGFASITGLTINPNAQISAGKTMLTVSGTITCSAGQSLTELSVNAFQQKGNRETIGFGVAINWNPYTYPPLPVVACTGSPIPWQATVDNSLPMSGLWQSGPLSVRARANVCIMMIDPWTGLPIDCEPGTWESIVIDARIHAN